MLYRLYTEPTKLSYQVIARKWRPQSFQELIGQDHISHTLLNALRSERLAHALLFTGPRGTGKTSSARILAKSLRCLHSVDFVPCHKCSSCLEIAQSRSVDVIEIDGASNNGVDAIRELRDTVGYLPSSGKNKVYIIDEVHMLSTSAFNALLKTLEEPPGHVTFVLATTEAHKIPQTILSRCQRFDFRRIQTKIIFEHLKNICISEKVEAEEKALWLIARQGDGSMRDAQSLLEQMITFTNQHLDYLHVIETLGLTDRSLLLEALTALLNRNPKAIITVLEKFLQTATEPHLFAQDLMEVIRNLTVVKVSGEAGSLILDLPDSEVQILKDLAESIPVEELNMLFDMALKGVNDILKSHDTRLVLEMVLIRLASSPKMMSLQKLFTSSSSSLTPATQMPPMTTASATASVQPQRSAVVTPTSAPSAVVSTLPLESQKISDNEKWVQFVGLVKKQDGLFGAKLENLYFLGIEGKRLKLATPPKQTFLQQQLSDPQTIKKLQAHIDSIWGSGYAFDTLVAESENTGISARALNQQSEQTKASDLKQQIADHPLIKTAQAVFKGQITSIKETP
jgi:DNA polymerase-3 subunit gamma/tau